MKSIVFVSILLVCLSYGSAISQGKAPAIVKSEMKKLAYLAGNWRGEASIQKGPGLAERLWQEEAIQFKLDSTILIIEGTGRSMQVGNAIVFNALAIVSYDQYKKEFRFKSHVMDGNQKDAYFKILSENNFEWGFEIQNNAKLKYSIVLDSKAKTWTEKGYYSANGTDWYTIAELNLTKLD